MIFLVVLAALICSGASQSDAVENCTTPSGESGFCVVVKKCPSLIQIWNDTAISQKTVLVHLLKELKCGYEDLEYKVCCTPYQEEPLKPVVLEEKNVPPKLSFNDFIYIGSESSTLNKIWESAMAIFTYMDSPLPDSDSCTMRFNGVGTTGMCMYLYECPYYVSMLNDTVNLPIVQELVNLAHCGIDEKKPKACCPFKTITPEKESYSHTTAKDEDQTNEMTQNVDDMSASSGIKHVNFHLLPEKCGNIESDRISGGFKTGVFEFPWMALIGYKTVSNTTIHFGCGGSIINDRYILTAAHCVSEISPLVVRVGEHNLNTYEDCEGEENDNECTIYEDIIVESFVIHPQYTKLQLDNDIALIKLEKPIQKESVCLPVSQNLREKELINESMVVAGWGFTEKGKRSEELLKTRITVMDNSKCTQRIKKTGSNGISSTKLCAGGLSEADSCKGDSGGPSVVHTEVYGVVRAVQYGIVSYGPEPCGIVGIPGVYTNVAHYIDWILDCIGQ